MSRSSMRKRFNKIVLITVALLVVLLPLGLATTVVADPQFTQEDRLFASDAEANDVFGDSVGVSGDTAIIGAPGEDSLGNGAGAAYLFTNSGTRWAQTNKLAWWDTEAGDRFGESVAIDGNYTIMGAGGDDANGSSSGSAFIFYYNAGQWEPQRQLNPSDPNTNDDFGTVVDINGDTAIVSAPTQNEARPGAVYVFTRSGTSWTQQQKLTASDSAAGDYFGQSVALDGDTIVVGRPQENSFQGSAYVFTRTAGVWTQQKKLLLGEASPNDDFGWDVAVDESAGTILVGAPGRNFSRPNQGLAAVYTGGGASWTEVAGLSSVQPSSDSDRAGTSVDIDNGIAVVGTPYFDEGSSDQGCVWAFGGAGNSWSPYPIMREGSPTVGSGYGGAVDISSGRVVVGARLDHEKATGAGSAQIFDYAASSSPLTYWDNDVSITFNSITVPGNFTATTRFESVNTTPTGYVPTERTLFDISTTVSYSGTFTVSIPYSDSNVPNWLNMDGPVDEADLKMLHWDGEGWAELPSTVDTEANTVSGVASSFSEFMIVESGEATSNPYYDWTPDGPNAGALGTPHKDYRTTTRKCAVCHSVHNASPNGELLLPTTVANACIYCHITTTLGSIVIYGGDPANYLLEDDYGHQAAGGATCTGCHSVHGSNTIDGAIYGTKILHAGNYQTELVDDLAGGDADAITSDTPPGGVWGYGWRSRDVQLSAFCTRCHQNYAYVSSQTIAATGLRTHPLRNNYRPSGSLPDIIGLGIEVAIHGVQGCSDGCHDANDTSGAGVNLRSFPHHVPTADKMLDALAPGGGHGHTDAVDSETDDVCLVCHITEWESGVPSLGVGVDY